MGTGKRADEAGDDGLAKMTDAAAGLARADDVHADDTVARAQAGDADACSALLEAYYGLIYRLAYRFCGNRADAEDIAHDVCIKLATAIRSFDGRAAFATWVYRVTLNAVRDHQRRTSRRETATLSWHAERDTSQPPGQESRVEATQLWNAVRKLPDKQREAVMLVYAEELAHAEAAAIMECSESTVSWHVHEARKALRDLI